MNVKPLGKRVLIKRKKSEKKTDSGLYIPDTAQEKTQEGEIVALGTEGDFPVAIGDRVMFEKYGGTEFEIGDEKLLILNVSDVLAKVG